MRRALITGASGQDGWYLADQLVADGCRVFGLIGDDDVCALPPGVEHVPGDMRSGVSLRAALDAVWPDEVYNLAAVSSVEGSWADPETTCDVNGTGVVRLLDAVQAFQVATGRVVRLVHASSAEIFGNTHPAHEDTSPAPTNPYGVAKTLAHHAVALYRATGIAAGSAILYNHESPRRPEHFVSRKITRAAARIATGAQEQVALGNLDAHRDWGFAGDYMRALVLIARHPVPGDFVIASGHSHSVRQFVAAAFERAAVPDWQAHVRVDERLLRVDDVADRTGDPRRAREVLGWRPTTSFAALVESMVDAEFASLGRCPVATVRSGR